MATYDEVAAGLVEAGLGDSSVGSFTTEDGWILLLQDDDEAWDCVQEVWFTLEDFTAEEALSLIARGFPEQYWAQKILGAGSLTINGEEEGPAPTPGVDLGAQGIDFNWRPARGTLTVQDYNGTLRCYSGSRAQCFQWAFEFLDGYLPSANPSGA